MVTPGRRELVPVALISPVLAALNEAIHPSLCWESCFSPRRSTEVMQAGEGMQP